MNQKLSRLGPDAEWIGAGDEVAIVPVGEPRIVGIGIVIDIAENGKAIVNVDGEWVDRYAVGDLAHCDSDYAQTAAMFQEDFEEEGEEL